MFHGEWNWVGERASSMLCLAFVAGAVFITRTRLSDSHQRPESVPSLAWDEVHPVLVICVGISRRWFLLWDILCSSNRVTVSVYIVRVFLVHRTSSLLHPHLTVQQFPLCFQRHHPTTWPVPVMELLRLLPLQGGYPSHHRCDERLELLDTHHAFTLDTHGFPLLGTWSSMLLPLP